MRANAMETENQFRDEEVATTGSNTKGASQPVFNEPNREFQVISRNPKTTDQRQDPSNILATRQKTTHEPLLNAREVANKLGVSERWVRDHTTRRSPKIRAVKLGPLGALSTGRRRDVHGKPRHTPLFSRSPISCMKGLFSTIRCSRRAN
jgi:hypothetical protein